MFIIYHLKKKKKIIVNFPEDGNTETHFIEIMAEILELVNPQIKTESL